METKKNLRIGGIIVLFLIGLMGISCSSDNGPIPPIIPPDGGGDNPPVIIDQDSIRWNHEIRFSYFKNNLDDEINYRIDLDVTGRELDLDHDNYKDEGWSTLAALVKDHFYLKVSPQTNYEDDITSEIADEAIEVRFNAIWTKNDRVFYRIEIRDYDIPPERGIDGSSVKTEILGATIEGYYIDGAGEKTYLKKYPDESIKMR